MWLCVSGCLTRTLSNPTADKRCVDDCFGRCWIRSRVFLVDVVQWAWVFPFRPWKQHEREDYLKQIQSSSFFCVVSTSQLSTKMFSQLRLHFILIAAIIGKLILHYQFDSIDFQVYCHHQWSILLDLWLSFLKKFKSPGAPFRQLFFSRLLNRVEYFDLDVIVSLVELASTFNPQHWQNYKMQHRFLIFSSPPPASALVSWQRKPTTLQRRIL